jgi:hypothetical protein
LSGAGTRQRNLKKYKKIFAGCQVRRHPAKKFKKNKKILCRVPGQGHPAKKFKKNKKKSYPFLFLACSA